MQTIDVLIIGGGPAGMAAALSAKENGAGSVLIVERNDDLGGILMQCIHNGFGLELFGSELTGPEFAQRYKDKIKAEQIPYILNTMVISINKDREVLIQNEDGMQTLKAKAIVVATGCRERPRGAILIPGTRPAGVFSAGTAQKLINCSGFMVGKRIVILGSGDIGLIMARRLTLEGAKVLAVCELMPYSSGLTRNVVQCLEDFDIPLYLSHTVTKIFGKDRVSGVEISKVDENGLPIKENKIFLECDTLLLSVGLIPENELCESAEVLMDIKTGGPVVNDRLETSVDGIFSCGNALHVHDLADFASLEAEEAGKHAAEFARLGERVDRRFAFIAGNEISSVVPQHISGIALREGVTLYMRTKRPCARAHIEIKQGEKTVKIIKSTRLTPAEMVKTTLQDVGEGDLTAEVVFDE